jgi:hypothetical protein
MHVVEMSSSKEVGTDPSPHVPLQFEYVCSDCPELHRITKLALVDTGANRALLARRWLPDGVRWETLPRTGLRFNVFPPREFECRLWHVDLSVFGRLIGREILVTDDTFRTVPVVGRLDFLQAFNVSFAFGSQPALMYAQPVGQVEPMPTYRWRIDHEAQTWEAVVSIDDPRLARGMRVVGPPVSWTGKPGLPTIADLPPPSLNREQRRRLGAGH